MHELYQTTFIFSLAQKNKMNKSKNRLKKKKKSHTTFISIPGDIL